jgi:hypothetical protein
MADENLNIAWSGLWEYPCHFQVKNMTWAGLPESLGFLVDSKYVVLDPILASMDQ